MPRDTREPQEILEHIIRSRAALTATMYGLSQEQLLKAGAVGRWSVKDIMAHIGHWEKVTYEVIQMHLQKQKAPEEYNDYLAMNDKWESQLHALSLQESIDLFETAHHRLFALLCALQPEQWRGRVRVWVSGATWGHYEEHTEDLQAWRNQQAVTN